MCTESFAAFSTTCPQLSEFGEKHNSTLTQAQYMGCGHVEQVMILSAIRAFLRRANEASGDIKSRLCFFCFRTPQSTSPAALITQDALQREANKVEEETDGAFFHVPAHLSHPSSLSSVPHSAVFLLPLFSSCGFVV